LLARRDRTPRRLDSTAAGDGGTRFAVYFMLVVRGAPVVKSAIYDCSVSFTIIPSKTTTHTHVKLGQYEKKQY